jgi:hypothetical protein
VVLDRLSRWLRSPGLNPDNTELVRCKSLNLAISAQTEKLNTGPVHAKPTAHADKRLICGFRSQTWIRAPSPGWRPTPQSYSWSKLAVSQIGWSTPFRPTARRDFPWNTENPAEGGRVHVAILTGCRSRDSCCTAHRLEFRGGSGLRESICRRVHARAVR